MEQWAKFGNTSVSGSSLTLNPTLSTFATMHSISAAAFSNEVCATLVLLFVFLILLLGII